MQLRLLLSRARGSLMSNSIPAPPVGDDRQAGSCKRNSLLEPSWWAFFLRSSDVDKIVPLQISEGNRIGGTWMHADAFNVTRHISGTLISRRTGTMIHAAPERDAALHVYSMINILIEQPLRYGDRTAV